MNGNMINVSWSELKTFIQNKNTSLQYININGGYLINAVDGTFVVQSFIEIGAPDSSDQLDFENNYKSDANKDLQLKPELVDGELSLRTFGIQAIESLKGFDPIADTWFYIGTESDSSGAGSAGDTVRVQIAAGDDATLFPAVDVTSTLTATEEDDETKLGDLIVSDLNNNSNFSTNFFAKRIYDNSVTVHISAKYPGPQGARPNSNDFQVSSTGTTVVTVPWDSIIQRNKILSLGRDPADPTLGSLGISGDTTPTEGEVTGRIIEYAENSGSNNLLVNGSGTPVEFTIPASDTKERFITALRFEALGNGIQFTKFLSQNSALNNGVLVKIRSKNSELVFPSIQTTEDFASIFARGPSDFNFFDVAGADYFRATLTFPMPFQLHKNGTFLIDDKITVTIQDNLNSGITRFRFLAFGFERDF